MQNNCQTFEIMKLKIIIILKTLVWVKMLFTVFELLPSKETRELTLGEKGDVVKVTRDKSWGRIPWHIPERYQGTCSALVLFWPRYKE